MDISSIPYFTFAPELFIESLKPKTRSLAKTNHIHTWQLLECHQSNFQKDWRKARIFIVLLSISRETKTSSAEVSRYK